MKSLFEQLGGTYTRQGDYCLPDVYTARNVAAPSDASRRRTLPDGGAASNIKRRESLDFQGFFEGKAGADPLFDLGISKILGAPRPAPDALS